MILVGIDDGEWTRSTRGGAGDICRGQGGASQVAYSTVRTSTRTHGNDYELLNRYLITQYVSGPAKGTRYVFRTPPPPRDPVLSRNEGVTRSWDGPKR